MSENNNPNQSVETQKKVDLSIKVKFLIFFLTSIILIIGIFWMKTNNYVATSTEINTQKVFEDAATNISNQINMWIEMNYKQMEILAKSSAMNSMNQASQTTELKEFVKTNPWVYLAFTTDMNGKNIARSDKNPLTDYSDRVYVKDIRDGKKSSWQIVVGKTSGKPALILSTPIMSDGEKQGVFAIAMTLNELSKQVINWRRGATGSAFLMDNENHVIASRDNQYNEKFQTFPYPIDVIFESSLTSYNDKDGSAYIAMLKETVFGWKILVSQSRSEVYQDLNKFRNFMFIVIGVILVVMIPVVILLAGGISSDILKLADIADRLSNGELGLINDVKSNDEIGVLADSIRKIQRSLKIAHDMLSKK